MKIVQQDFALNPPGSLKIIVEEQDDLWIAYNIIAKGDTFVADTTRRVVSSDNLNRKKPAPRVKIRLQIKVTDVSYEKDSPILRVRGRTLISNKLMPSGSYHTLEIERHKEFDLTKEVWSSDVINTLHESEKASTADLAVIIFQQESGQVFLVGHKTTLCAKIEASKTDSKAASNKFYEKVFQAFVKHFRGYLFQEAHRLKMKSIEDNKSRFMMVNIGNKSSLKEIFSDQDVMGLIIRTKAGMEIRVYKEFSDLLLLDSDRACYGPKSVEIAKEMMAIETLLIIDDLVKSKDIALRRKYTELAKSVKKAGGKAIVFSSKHVSGEQLAKLTGIAAILRFPIPNIDDLYYFFFFFFFF
ncbi:hypothetical protein E1A91_A04G093400v1 [Gossypium mustelinum]|uniref:eRF1/Pelota-like N-terminal domain-containing protein n=1 Tax=Gossypium mustelinum TaxID=34275 RepID=A0A5D2ZLG1_GOSMU|nr:hypothetical protein E1A91_A04G093400v1 [Gossypium mustelinum]